MTRKIAPYLAVAAIALALPTAAFAQSASPKPGAATAPPEIQAPSMNDRMAPGGLRSPTKMPEMNQPFEAAELKGKVLYDKTGEKVGSIEDVVPKTGQTRDAVVEVGGILGVGAKKVLVPASDISRNDKGRLVVAMSEEQLKKLPSYE